MCGQRLLRWTVQVLELSLPHSNPLGVDPGARSTAQGPLGPFGGSWSQGTVLWRAPRAATRRLARLSHPGPSSLGSRAPGQKAAPRVPGGRGRSL